MDLSITREERNWRMGAHLSALAGYVLPLFGWLLGPLFVWWVKKDLPFVEDQAKEALNFQMSMLLYTFLSMATFLFGIAAVIALIVPTLIAVVDLVLLVVAAIRASAGVKYRYPFTIRMLK